MNGFAMFFLVVYAINILVGMYKLSLGDKLVKAKTNRSEGMARLIGASIGLPMFLAAIGVI